MQRHSCFNLRTKNWLVASRATRAKEGKISRLILLWRGCRQLDDSWLTSTMHHRTSQTFSCKIVSPYSVPFAATRKQWENGTSFVSQGILTWSGRLIWHRPSAFIIEEQDARAIQPFPNGVSNCTLSVLSKPEIRTFTASSYGGCEEAYRGSGWHRASR